MVKGRFTRVDSDVVDHLIVKDDKKEEALDKDNKVVNQLIDLALLQNGMLKAAALDAFLKRSVDMINKY